MTSVLQRNNVQVKGEGPQTVILAHGFGTDQTAWQRQQEALSERYRLVLFDHVGAGGADPAAYSPHRYRSLYSYAADLLELLRELQISQAIYIGHSMSAMIGLLAALQEPEHFAKMVFIGASPRYLNDEGYYGGFEQPELDALYATMSSNYLAWVSGFAGLAMENPERQELTAELARTLGAIRPDIAVAVARLIYQSDYRVELPRLRIPTLVIQTRHDIAVPVEVGEYLARQLPQAKLALIDAWGHFPHMSAPAAVNAALESFLH